MWHTDYKQLDDGRWFIAYEDDASRFITGYGVFERATTQNALSVLYRAIKDHGKPASVMTDHGSQFYSNASEYKKKGASEFEQELVRLEIRHILASVGHPQTNGKLERFHGELQRKLHLFEPVTDDPPSRPPTGYVEIKDDPTDGGSAVRRFVQCHNEIKYHMSLNPHETPAQAFIRKMPEPGGGGGCGFPDW